MNEHNKDILEAIDRAKGMIRIDELINRELGTKTPSESYYRLFNLYTMLDIENLLRGAK